MDTDKPCDCEWCGEHKILKRIIATVPLEEDKKWLWMILEKYWHIDMELNYLEAIKDGSWPSAIKTMQYWIRRAIIQRKGRGENWRDKR